MKKSLFLLLSYIAIATLGCAPHPKHPSSTSAATDKAVSETSLSNRDETEQMSVSPTESSESENIPQPDAQPEIQKTADLAMDANHQTEQDAAQMNSAPQSLPTDMVDIRNVTTWYDDVLHATDQTSIEKVFAKKKYNPGPDAYAFIARIYADAQGNQVYAPYSYRDTAFTFSHTPKGEERFWPASTVKLTAAVMAMMRIESFGLDADDPVTYNDLDELKQTTVRKLAEDAIIPSDNQAYNGLMLITGLDRANDIYIRQAFHFPTMVLQRRYFKKNKEDNLRQSPLFTFQHQNQVVEIPPEESTHFFTHVPRDGNGTTLVELAEILRRVMTGQFLTLTPKHLTILRDALLKAPSCVGIGVERAHSGDLVYNKGGKVIGDDRLEIAYITDKHGQPKYLLALSLPYSEEVDTLTNELAYQLITAVDALEKQKKR